MNNYAEQLGYHDDLSLLLDFYGKKHLLDLIHSILHVVDDADGSLEEMFNDYVEELVLNNINLKEDVKIMED
tara:strand:- start:289 stop:504 length:216 start_codon:yes stop_codon:yes gene_type:complete